MDEGSDAEAEDEQGEISLLNIELKASHLQLPSSWLFILIKKIEIEKSEHVI